MPFDKYEPVEEFGGKPLETPMSLTELTKGVSYQDPTFPLILSKPKQYAVEDRPKIDSTKWQRLSYYRGYCSTQAKTEIIATKNVKINSFLWFYALNVFFKTMPHNFVHFFIASYAPEEHMFVTKMAPVFYGLKYLFVVVGLTEICSNMDTMVLLFRYSIEGVLNRNPWNRCKNSTYFDPQLNITMHCYGLDEFVTKFYNTTNLLLDYCYLSPEDEHFQVSQIEYYRNYVYILETSWNITDFVFVWLVIHGAQYAAGNRLFWRALNLVQWGINIMDLMTYIYLSIIHLNEDPDTLYNSTSGLYLRQNELQVGHAIATDLEMLAESITAPPIVHVLTARSSQPINPYRDSAVMVMSNAMIYIFRGLLSHRVKTHCEGLVGAEISFLNFNEHSWFYYWPMLWEGFYLGDIISIIYLSLNCICELLILVVTYRCIVEIVVTEWPNIERWMFTIITFVIGVAVYCTSRSEARAILWAYGKGIATLAETVAIYYLYPVGRLVDDFTYHYGEPPTKLTIYSMKMVPLYYAFKLYIMFSGMWNILDERFIERNKHYLWSWPLMLVPIALGFVYVIYKYIHVYGMTWPYMLRPQMSWGPKDFSVRQLRKHYDSRFYIASHVPRLLSRYIISKKDTKVVKVNVKYDFMRRSTATEREVRFTDKSSSHVRPTRHQPNSVPT